MPHRSLRLCMRSHRRAATSWTSLRAMWHETKPIGQLAPDLIFHGIQGADAFECLERLRGALGLMHAEEFAAHVSPASCLDQRTLHPIVQAVEPAIRIGLQDTAEGLQMVSRPLALAIRRVMKPHGWWIGTTGRPIISHIGPKSPHAALAGTGGQNAARGVIGMQLVGAQTVATKQRASAPQHMAHASARRIQAR